MNKKYLIKSINFGEENHPARLIIEKYIEKNGNLALSSMIRKLVCCYCMDKPEYNNWKKDFLIYKRKNIGKEINEKIIEKKKIDDELEKLGVDINLIY